MTEADSLAAGSPLPGDFSPRDALVGWMQEIAPYGIFTTDVDLRIRSWNHWLVLHSGLAAEAVIDRPLFEVFPSAQTRGFEEHFRRALAGEVSMLSTALHKYLLPLPVVSGDFDVPHMLQTARIAPLPGGEVIVGTITIIEDVTQRECQALTLHRQQQRDRLLSDALGVLLRSTNPLMDVAALFPRIAPPLGVEAYANYLFDAKTQTLRLSSASGMPPKQKDALSVVLLGEGLAGLCAERREPIRLSHVQQSDDPHAYVAKSSGLRAYCCFPLQIGDRLVGTLSFGTYSRDVIAPDEMEFLSTIAVYVAIAIDRALRESDLQLAQRSLLEHADNLEAKVAERTARLHETIAQLESFSYTVAHDLRAPIRSLQGYCEILRTEYPLPEQGAAIVERLQRASNRLDALTRDLLRFTRITRQQVHLEPVDVDETIADLFVLNPELKRDVLTVRMPLGRVWAHRTLLQQCLSNLLDNALKFVAVGVTPRIVIRSERRDAAAETASDHPEAFHPATRSTEPEMPEGSPEATATRLRIWVEDNGIGIAPEVHQKIFGIFERVGGQDHIEGTGIGLAIVARAVEQMKGTCGVESTPGQGSRFWLEFSPADSHPGA